MSFIILDKVRRSHFKTRIVVDSSRKEQNRVNGHLGSIERGRADPVGLSFTRNDEEGSPPQVCSCLCSSEREQGPKLATEDAEVRTVQIGDRRSSDEGNYVVRPIDEAQNSTFLQTFMFHTHF